MTDHPTVSTVAGVDVQTRTTEYEVCALPESNINYPHYVITVEYRGAGRWAVTRMRQCLSVDGRWDWESLPSERGGQWLDRHRFDLDTALRLARTWAPTMTCNGRTVTEVLTRKQEEKNHG
jgi:hypothetical protein